jgi:hypothetical protein
MESKKIELLKKVKEFRENKISVEFESLEIAGFNRGLIRSMIKQGYLQNSSTSVSMTSEGERTLNESLILERLPEELKEKFRVIFDSNIYDHIAEGKLIVDDILKSEKITVLSGTMPLLERLQ